MLLGISMIATAETLNLGKRMGMDPKLLSEIIATSTGRNWSLDTYNPVPGVMQNVPSSRDYAGGFAIELMTKDMGLATQAAIDTHTPCFLGELSRSMYEKAGASVVKEGSQHKELKGKDFSVVYKYLSQ
jgi:3-hydroxyisobutyrate dehydrogenase